MKHYYLPKMQSDSKTLCFCAERFRFRLIYLWLESLCNVVLDVGWFWNVNESRWGEGR